MESQVESTIRPEITVPLDGGWSLLPLLSAAGGAWAYNRGLWTQGPATLGILLALIVGGWQPLWHAFTRTDWATPLKQWPGWSIVAPIPKWPYVQSGTPGDHLHHRLGLARSWWRELGRMYLSHPLRRAIGALIVSVLLGLALGRMSLLLTIVLLAVAELATLWHEGRGLVRPLWTSIALAAIPWFFGASLDNASTDILPALSSVALALMIGLYAQPNGWAAVGPLIGAAFLLWQGHATAVGWLLLLAIPGLMVLTTRPSGERYRRTIGLPVLAMVALMAWTL